MFCILIFVFISLSSIPAFNASFMDSLDSIPNAYENENTSLLDNEYKLILSSLNISVFNPSLRLNDSKGSLEWISALLIILFIVMIGFLVYIAISYFMKFMGRTNEGIDNQTENTPLLSSRNNTSVKPMINTESLEAQETKPNETAVDFSEVTDDCSSVDSLRTVRSKSL